MRMRNQGYTAIAAACMLLTTPLAAKTISVPAGKDAQTRLQEALISAEPGDVVSLGEGRFTLTDGLSLDVAKVTVKGQGSGKSILDFTGQLGAGEGLLVTSDDVVLRDFAVENTKGDGIKSKGADRIVYYNLRVEWTAGPKETNGAYGVYPVESKDVLVDSVFVRGASDAGIYVGQSRNIVVRNSVAIENVAGIEIENSYDADVHDNLATRNTGGILVFDLPNLLQMGGRNVRIFENVVVDNMTPNFAPKGNIVASVPTGTGIMVMANRKVQIFDNMIGENGTANVMIVGYRFEQKDPKYDPLARDVAVWGNQHEKAGWDPKFAGGDMIAKALGGSLPPIFWDGAGGEANKPYIGDLVPVLNLNLADIAAQPDTAQPTIMPPWMTSVEELPPVTLPASMEAVVR
ncbi:MAG: parallel beta-helix domain-containing protein [Sphingorhabdus sp.]|jgi:parallel beta-helix repeat protein|uniref:parallel beta-helix domain-containing protein n=2 Tax=Sphingorhabdus sp. TaxID=1902408 RepID=UPI003BB141EC